MNAQPLLELLEYYRESKRATLWSPWLQTGAFEIAIPAITSLLQMNSFEEASVFESRFTLDMLEREFPFISRASEAH